MPSFATRNGQPAHIDAPEPRKAEITMADWMAGHDGECPPIERSFRVGITVCAALLLTAVLAAAAAFG